MVREIIMPKLGETMEEGYLTKWFKEEGQKVEKGEVVFEVMSDKTNFEVESPYAGYLRKIIVPASENAIPVTSVVGYLADAMDESVPEITTPPPTPSSSEESRGSIHQARGSDKSDPYITAEKPGGPIMASPLAKKIAKELGVDLASVKGTGPDGRITEKDVRSAANVAPKVEGVTKKRLSPLRQIIAERLSKSKREIPHYYLRKILDVSSLVASRKKLKAEGQDITYTDLLIKVVADTLMEFPEMNATYENNDLTIYPEVNLGLAIARPEGLIVPVLTGVNRKTLSEITKERKRLVETARQDKLAKEDLEGGTFTLSNLGLYEIDAFSAIIYQPQVAILAIGAIKEGVSVSGSSPVIKPLVEVTLSCDHRVVDGSYSAQFLQKLQEKIHKLT